MNNTSNYALNLNQGLSNLLQYYNTSNYLIQNYLQLNNQNGSIVNGAVIFWSNVGIGTAPIFAKCCINQSLLVYGSIGCDTIGANSMNITGNLGVATITATGQATVNSLNVNNNFSVDSGGNISGTTLIATNIGIKSPITFTTGTRTTTVSGDTYYLYDIDLRNYTHSIKLGSYNYRQFRARTWESDGAFENLGFISQNKYDIFMSDYNGLSIRSYSYFDNQDLSLLNIIVSHTLLRNSFNFITYASRLAPATVYMIIEDLL